MNARSAATPVQPVSVSTEASNGRRRVLTRLGIDVGGTGIKGAPVDIATGHPTAERLRILTPHPATPSAVAEVIAGIAGSFGDCSGPIGVTLPAVVRNGVTTTAANIDPSWLGVNASEVIGRGTGRPVTVLNDADAAGVAEMAYGAGRGRMGVVVMVTFGTGSGRRSSLMASCSPTPSSGTSRSGGATPSAGQPRA